MTAKEVKTKTEVGVGIHTLWKAFTQDFRHVFPKVSKLVKSVDVVEGDGGLGTIYLLHFGPEVEKSYQKEKVAELDESVHRFGLEVVEGWHLDHGFSYYKTTLQMTSIGEEETLIDVTVTYESETDEQTVPSKTASTTVEFIKCLGNYLVNTVMEKTLMRREDEVLVWK